MSVCVFVHVREREEEGGDVREGEGEGNRGVIDRGRETEQKRLQTEGSPAI